MNKLFTLLSLFAILLTGNACAKKGDLTFINKTDQNIYYTLKGSDYILPGKQTHSYTFNLGKETLLNTPEKEVPISIYGETFSLEDNETTTTVTILPDKNLKLYLWPTHAGLKIINHSNYPINNVIYKQFFKNSTFTSPNLLANQQTINPQDSLWFRIPFSSLNQNNPSYFYYNFSLKNTLNENIIYGDSTLVLDKGQQYRIEIR